MMSKTRRICRFAFWHLGLLIAMAGLTGCVGGTQSARATPEALPPRPWLDATPFGQPTPLVETEEIFRLTPAQRETFLAYFHADRNRSVQPNQRVADFLDARMDDFNYHSDTLTAAEAMDGKQGNCMSLAVLTSALAALVDVEVEYKLVETRPVYQKEADVVVTSRHARTKLLDPPVPQDPDSLVLRRGGVVVDYFPLRGSRRVRTIDQAEFLSMFYQNHAGEALIDQDYDRAYWLLRRALELKPTSPAAINMMALTYNHRGRPEIADRLYRYGLERAEDRMDLLDNYHALLKAQGRDEEARRIAARIEALDVGNPFRWISVGNDSFNRGEYARALHYFKKASELAPYLADAHAGVARAQYALGRYDAARRALEEALANAHRDDNVARYQAKYQSLVEVMGQ